MSSVSRSISCPPKYCRQRSKGRGDRAYVRLNGRKFMLCAYGSEESHKKYAELVGANQQEKPVLKILAKPAAAEVLVAYLTHVRRYYA